MTEERVSVHEAMSVKTLKPKAKEQRWKRSGTEYSKVVIQLQKI
jgi:hypothetical protein